MLPRLTRKGVAAVEFGLVAPFVIMLLIALTDLGLAAYAWMGVQHAAQAGAHFAAARAWDPIGVAAAVEQASGPIGVTASPAPQLACACALGSSLSWVTCSTACANGATAGQYVIVHAQVTYTTLLPYPGLPSTWILTADATARLE